MCLYSAQVIVSHSRSPVRAMAQPSGRKSVSTRRETVLTTMAARVARQAPMNRGMTWPGIFGSVALGVSRARLKMPSGRASRFSSRFSLRFLLAWATSGVRGCGLWVSVVS